MTKPWLIYVVAGSLAANLFLLPLLVNPTINFQYAQLMAHWRARLAPPPAVFVGDSIMAAQQGFGDPSAIVLAQNGYTSCQAADTLVRAAAYRPARIYALAGVNDVFQPGVTEAIVRQCWERIAAMGNSIAILPPPTRDAALNARLERIRAIIRETMAARGRPVIAVPGLAGPDGLLRPEYSADGVHLTPAGRAAFRRGFTAAKPVAP